jgi:hypothetical protein
MHVINPYSTYHAYCASNDIWWECNRIYSACPTVNAFPKYQTSFVIDYISLLVMLISGGDLPLKRHSLMYPISLCSLLSWIGNAQFNIALGPGMAPSHCRSRLLFVPQPAMAALTNLPSVRNAPSRSAARHTVKYFYGVFPRPCKSLQTTAAGVTKVNGNERIKWGMKLIQMDHACYSLSSRRLF